MLLINIHRTKLKVLILYTLLIFLSEGCKKIVEIPEPTNTVTLAKTFDSEANASSAIAAIYSDMSWDGNSMAYANSQTTISAGLASDELLSFAGGGSDIQFQTGTLLADDISVWSQFWKPAYYDIYMANAAIEGIQASSRLSVEAKDRLSGEAKFLRAFIYFYLVNLFGDVPLVTTSDWIQSSILPRTATTDIYKQIVQDLKDAQSQLPDDYSFSNGEKIRTNKWAATALLARVYLYMKDWTNAETQASLVISSGHYSLNADINTVFLKNSDEAILQLQTINNGNYSTFEGNKFVPRNLTKNPNYYLTDQLLASFETGDLRLANWTEITVFNGVSYYVPYKYKIQVGTPGNIKEYYMLLRFAEQYLIRAEANAQNSNLAAAISDINVIRQRAGLSQLPSTLTKSEVLAAVAQERRIEFFAELGHRWFDLKRTELAVSTLQPLKTGWTSNALLWPVPAMERAIDPNLTQNPGY